MTIPVRRTPLVAAAVIARMLERMAAWMHTGCC